MVADHFVGFADGGEVVHGIPLGHQLQILYELVDLLGTQCALHLRATIEQLTHCRFCVECCALLAHGALASSRVTSSLAFCALPCI